MAKKKKQSSPKGQLGDWLEEVPEDVQDAADSYDKSHSAKSKADGKMNTARDALVDLMNKNKVLKVSIRNGAKKLVLTVNEKISYEKPDGE